jgi:transcriptional regulator with XRE-family HTH domain
MTQAELAKAARISVPYLSQIETGNRVGTAEVLAAVAKALGLSIDDIVIPSVEING